MERIAKYITSSVSHSVEMLAAIMIGGAVLLALWNFGRSLINTNSSSSTEAVRVQFGSSVAVALELMLGADVLATAVSPNWSDLGKLAAIAVIRTALNYFLERELNHLRKDRMGFTTGEQTSQRA